MEVDRRPCEFVGRLVEVMSLGLMNGVRKFREHLSACIKHVTPAFKLDNATVLLPTPSGTQR